MNARHAHELIRLRFPVFVASAHDWHVVAHGDGNDRARILGFLKESFAEEPVVFRVDRKIRGMLPLEDVADVVAKHIGVAEVKIANRSFTRFAVVGHPGVATAWSAEDETQART